MLTTPRSRSIWVDVKGFTSAPNTVLVQQVGNQTILMPEPKFPRCCCLPLAWKVWLTSYASSGNIAAKTRSLFSIMKT